ncbi:MAG TPA: MmcQ/YjbR family DNA-binding protein [Pyrinomonadaceae bacterium]|nr:MmcQ/YjbR family DNA-binding protein [Pyrinomonadaceae bacterium]
MALSAQQLATADQRRKRLVRISQSLPEVTVQPLGHDGEHLVLQIGKKKLAYYQFDHHGDGMISLVCKSNLNEQRRLVQSDPELFFVPAYVGSRGWIGMRLDLDEVDWETATELLKRGYQEIAPRKLAMLLDI